MMDRDLLLSVFLPVKPEKVYNDWLDSAAHATFTGGAAKIEPVIRGNFSAWDGYISGKILELVPGKRVRQSWRTRDFPDDSPDSVLEILFQAIIDGTRLTLIHTKIPKGQSDGYEKGWEDYYFQPMKIYYGSEKNP